MILAVGISLWNLEKSNLILFWFQRDCAYETIFSKVSKIIYITALHSLTIVLFY